MKYTLMPLALITIVVLLTACKGKDTDDPPIVVPPDPSGTISYSFNYTTAYSYVHLYQGLDEHITSDVRYANVRLVLGDASLNFTFTSILALDYNIIQYLLISNGMGGEIADVGFVSGLGAVTEKPTSGWAQSVSAQLSHGYVCRFRHAYDYNAATELPYLYARAYVVSWIRNINNEIIGAEVKYQLPF